MHQPSQSASNLAKRLLAESRREAGNSKLPDAALVTNSLRAPLTQFAGAFGFATLLRRALAMAAAHVPALHSAKVTVTDDGHLEGLEDLAAHARSEQEAAALAITAHLLDLLTTFIGESLTHRLVRKLWPALSPNEQD
jgi:hypothetical protein